MRNYATKKSQTKEKRPGALLVNIKKHQPKVKFKPKPAPPTEAAVEPSTAAPISFELDQRDADDKRHHCATIRVTKPEFMPTYDEILNACDETGRMGTLYFLGEEMVFGPGDPSKSRDEQDWSDLTVEVTAPFKFTPLTEESWEPGYGQRDWNYEAESDFAIDKLRLDGQHAPDLTRHVLNTVMDALKA
jgi:hypothetical protein